MIPKKELNHIRCPNCDEKIEHLDRYFSQTKDNSMIIECICGAKVTILKDFKKKKRY